MRIAHRHPARGEVASTQLVAARGRAGVGEPPAGPVFLPVSTPGLQPPSDDD